MPRCLASWLSASTLGLAPSGEYAVLFGPCGKRLAPQTNDVVVVDHSVIRERAGHCEQPTGIRNVADTRSSVDSVPAITESDTSPEHRPQRLARTRPLKRLAQPLMTPAAR